MKQIVRNTGLKFNYFILNSDAFLCTFFQLPGFGIWQVSPTQSSKGAHSEFFLQSFNCDVLVDKDIEKHIRKTILKQCVLMIK